MSQITGINELPNELFVDILKESLPTKRPAFTLPREIVLSHVCPHWRATMLNEPLLWTKIEIYSSKSFERVHAYFSRSDPAPVDIFFDVWETDRIGRDSIDQIVDLVVEHIDRWQRLRFFASRVNTTHAFLTKIAHLSAPNLREFRVLDDGPGHANDLLQPLEVILMGGHPELRTVQIDKLSAMSLLSNVTTLHLREHNGTLYSVDLEVITALNENCPSLKTFSVHGNFDHNSITWNRNPTPALTMRSIEHLWFITEDKLPGKLLTAVSFPNLRSLWLHCPYQYLVQTLTSSPYRAKFPSLEYLTIQTFEFYLCQQLEAIFPDVKNLHFPACNSWNIANLHKAFNSGWPQVERLVLRTRGDTHPKKFTKLLEEIVVARQTEGGTPLKQVLLDRDALRCFTRDGVTASDEIRPLLKELTEDNYDDPWWVIIKTDKGIFH